MPYYVVGIIPVGSTVTDEYPLVQSRCHYNVLDVYTIAEVVQDYHSNATYNRDVEYVFPLPPSAAVCSFKAVIDDDRVIKGIVKEKGEAKKEYDEAVSQGKTAGLLQQEHADVFRVSLGNIKPNQKISVHISFVSVIPHDGSSPQALRITMPTAIAPRYGVAPTNIPWFKKNSGNRFELTVAIQMSKPVTSISSPSHPIGLTLGCAEKELTGDYVPSKAFVHLGDSAFLDKDIVIVISAQGLDAPRCTVERWLASEGAEKTTDAYALTLVPKFDLPALPSQEYIFLVDRSGSMGGGRMEAVKTSLQIMLKSLPSKNTTFNIVSFGSRYTSLWPKSQIYSAETVAEASKHVDTFTANYGGTELRSALQFAFNSRQALVPNSTDKPPASVFVLTDGEAWDLDGINNLVRESVESAKKQDGLLRAFVLGVGNQVSTAMCEGIARAGQGSTVFVAEGEKPDAKLMSLLKAARGGVIEELAIDWGAPEPAKESEDDFEMISDPSETEKPTPQAELPPLSLFDEATPSTETAEVGPQKIAVHLPPPPTIQQAPKSDKLPIPLYPGFRCSIFAIIKQSSNSGPHSPTIKITGKVLGRAVAFQVPVSPITINASTTAKAMESGKLLHTLAAKALIQIYEDMQTSAVTKAQIERLGKRYSLASSVTSFLAIDHESSSELRSLPVVHVAVPVPSLAPVAYAMIAPQAYASAHMMGGGLSRPSPPSQMQQMQALSSSRYKSFGSMPDRAMSPPSAPPPPGGGYQASSLSAVPTGYGGGGDVNLYSVSIGSSNSSSVTGMASVLERGERLDSLADKTESLKSAASFFSRRKKSAAPVAREREDARQYSPPPAPLPPPPAPIAPSASAASFAPTPGGAPPPSLAGYNYSSISSLVLTADRSAISGATSGGPLTLETIARAQQFDGSFSYDTAFLRKICEDKKAIPPIPALLAGLAGDAGVKQVIWATVLVLACLKRVFGGEKDSWEMMAEKATGFVQDALNDIGADGSAVCASLIASV